MKKTRKHYTAEEKVAISNPIRRSGLVVFLEFVKETLVRQPTVSQELGAHAVVERRNQVSA
jgi:hypothetical protein